MWTVRKLTKKGELVDKKVATDEITCIPYNMEKYMTFSIGQLQFIDSLQFMNSSLEKLAANLRTEDLKITGRGVSASRLELNTIPPNSTEVCRWISQHSEALPKIALPHYKL
jgi:hypothetical protein